MKKRGLSAVYLFLIIFAVGLLLALGLESLNKTRRESGLYFSPVVRVGERVVVG
ncbi:hypothetical protein HYV50_00760 [Candidatus Pacearchaeota archaeon]|nr:hypothetical protein [Candidatus Pacearchaeota archaeon]